jgi:hypothetical protein
MFNKAEVLAKVNQILDTDMKHKSYEETIELLVRKLEHQQNELKEAQCRELSYLDDIEQMEGMLSQANQRNEQLQEKLLNCKRKTTYAVYEENLKLAEELALIKGEMSG